MYDSDEEGDRRRENKFVRERRDDDRRGGGNGGYNRYDNKRPANRRDDYQAKRSRPEDDDAFDPTSRNTNDENNGEDTMYNGPLQTFKRFLAAQEDDIDQEEAIVKYNAYKIDHKKHLIERFFRQHKEEEWFRQKYNPEDTKKLKEAHLAHVNKRLEVFNQLKNDGTFDGWSLDYQNAEKIIRMLDAVVVKLEDGSEDELKSVLAQKLEDESITDLKKENGENGVKEEEVKPVKTEAENGGEEGEEGAIDDDGDKNSKVNIHKTCSVFLRNIPPGLTRDELEALCKRSPGFLRLALTDGIAERKFFRRGWVTFKREVNIKEICWNLNSHRLRETDLNAIINRDITRRVRTTNGVAAHRQVATNDLKLAVKLVALYDKRLGLYNASEESEEDREKDIRMGVDLVSASTNPLLKEVRGLVPQDAIDELSAEEAELLGVSNGGDGGGDRVKFDRDDDVLKALDLLILYLRIVHSIDFYNHGHYSQEDNMPHRCGLLHVRGQPPSGAQITNDDDGNLILPQKFVQDFIHGFNTRVEKNLIEKQYINEEDQVKMGKKDAEKDIEAFVLKNTVELAKDKWLCPLSGKKFKGPEFIRKHLQSKHEDALEKVRAETLFFNNYLADASRPVDAEPRAPAARDDAPRNDRGGGGYVRERDDDRGGHRNSMNNYDRPRGPPPQRNSFGGGPRRYFDDGPGGGGGSRRPQVCYRDLDAPEDIP